MHWKDILINALVALRVNKLRTRITITIIALGITALVGIITSIKAIENAIDSNFSVMGANTITIRKDAWFGNNNKSAKPIENKNITYNEVQLFKQNFDFPAIIGSSIMCSQNAIVTKNQIKTNPNIWIRAVDENSFKIGDNKIEQGRYFTPRELLTGTPVCLLGNALAKQLFKNNRAINSTINVNNITYLVIGVVQAKGNNLIDRTDNMVFINIENAMQHFNISSKGFNIDIKINDVKLLNLASSHATGTMRIVRKLPAFKANNFSVNKNNAIVESLIENSRKVTIAGMFIGLITLLGAAISLMNIMLVAVAERTKEIGLQKAIGAAADIIKKQFLAESILISLYGGLWGIIIGVLVGNVISLIIKSSFFVPWLWLAIAIILCTLVGILSGIYPAIKASKLNPIQALRFE
jgi:putative ABC transport system permease protein